MAGDGGMGVICTDMAIKAMEWVRSLGKRAPGSGAGGGRGVL